MLALKHVGVSLSHVLPEAGLAQERPGAGLAVNDLLVLGLDVSLLLKLPKAELRFLMGKCRPLFGFISLFVTLTKFGINDNETGKRDEEIFLILSYR